MSWNEKDGQPNLVQEITQEWASLQLRLREDLAQDLERHLSAQDRLLQQLLQRQRQEGAPRLGRRGSWPKSPSISDASPGHPRPVSSWRSQGRSELKEAEAEAAAWLDEALGASAVALETTLDGRSERRQEERPDEDEAPTASTDARREARKGSQKMTHAQLRKLASDATGGGGSMAEELQLQLEAHVHDFKTQEKKSMADMSSKDIRTLAVHRFFGAVDWWLSLEEPPRASPLARAVRSNVFEFISFVMVITNCLFIIVSKNWSLKNLGGAYPPDFLVIEVLYASYFLGELMMRLAVSRLYFFVNGDMGWNILDASIVMLSVWSTVNSLMGDSMMQLTFLRTLRVMKLARVLRMLRMVRFFTSLRIMIVAILDSMLVLFWCCVLLLFLILVFALLFVQFVEDFLLEHGTEGYDDLLLTFGSVQAAMLSLYMSVTGGNDWGYYYDILAVSGSQSGGFFVFFMTFYYFGVFNVITGIFVDKALRAAQPDMDLMLVDMRHKEKDFIQGFEHVLRQFDVNSDGVIQTKEFKQLVESHGGRMYLRMLGIEPKHTEVVFNGLQSINDHVSVADFVRGVMRMKGTANNLDVHAMHYEVSHVAKAQKGMMAALASIKEDIASMKHRA